MHRGPPYAVRVDVSSASALPRHRRHAPTLPYIASPCTSLHRSSGGPLGFCIGYKPGSMFLLLFFFTVFLPCNIAPSPPGTRPKTVASRHGSRCCHRSTVLQRAREQKKSSTSVPAHYQSASQGRDLGTVHSVQYTYFLLVPTRNCGIRRQHRYRILYFTREAIGTRDEKCSWMVSNTLILGPFLLRPAKQICG